MENWDDYRLVLAIHRGKTLRTAAQHLGVNHSTVARRIYALNKKFGVAVCINGQDGYSLSSFGTQLLASALEMEALTQKDQRIHRADSIQRKEQVTLSIPPAIVQFLLLEPLYRFQRRNPNITLNVKTSYDFADLDSCEADIVVRSTNTPDEHLVGRRLFPIHIAFYGHRDYLRKTQEQDVRWITNVMPLGTPDWIANTPFPDSPVSLKIEDLVLRHYAAQNKHGLVRGACYIAEQLEGLIRINEAPSAPFQDLWVLTHPDLRDTPRVRTVSQFLISALTEQQSLITGDANHAQHHCVENSK